MRLVYLQEGRPYTAKELVDKINEQLNPPSKEEPAGDSSEVDGLIGLLNHDNAVSFARRLKESMDNGLFGEDEKTIVKETKDGFSFQFVGLYDYMDKDENGKERNLVFFFLPKFIGKESPAWTDETRRNAIRDTVLLAIDRRNRELSRLDNQTDETERHKESILELAVRVLRDYLENGVYTVQRRELEHNGQGEIDWDTTIDQYQPVFQNGRPVYMDTATELALSDENHYITRLHQCLVTTWGRKLEELGLSSVLRVNVPLLCEDELDRFGPTEYQLDRIRKELNVQFVTKARKTLALIKELIERMSESRAEDDLPLSFGMNGVAQLWETTCAEVFGSELNKDFQKRGLDWNSGETFRDYMPRPIWKRVGDYSVLPDEDVDAYKRESEKSGWKLDFIRTYPQDGPVQKLVILDAKYYDVSWHYGKISGQPGIGDIAKQIFYQMAFEDLVRIKREGPKIGFVNAFLFPDDDDSKYCRKDDAGRPTIRVSETVQLGWKVGESEVKRACAFSGVNLFAIRIPGIELFRRYAHYEPAEDWFSKIATVDTDELFEDTDKK